MTSERFAQLVVSNDVVRRINTYRERLPELDRLKAEGRNKEAQAISRIKSGLPVLMYQATFDETISKKGFRGRWRKQAAARLNGLFMLDVDHVEHPQELFLKWLKDYADANYEHHPDGKSYRFAGYVFKPIDLKNRWANHLGILLIHVTPSGRGLRIVAKADAEVGNIADNQARLSQLLGVEPDAACKDASRCSFCPMLLDILFINKNELFTYENPEYDSKFGPQYRGGSSQPTTARGALAVHAVALPVDPALGHSGQTGNTAGEGTGVDGRTSEEVTQLDKINAGYHGKSYKEIVDGWFQHVQGGLPQAGDRHRCLYRLACDLRYITDFDPKLLARVLELSDVGADIIAERGREEIQRIATDACALQRWRNIPQRFRKVLGAVGIQLDGKGEDAVPRQVPAIDYEYWWQRLSPLLGDSPGYREAVAQLPEHHRMAGVLAAGAMLGTYLTRTWWEHFDGKYYRLSFLVYIIGSAASGKSFITDLDRLIMEPMRAADRVGREWERKYKEDMKARAVSSKNAKKEAPEQQHPVIRYVPSTVSNAMLYRRLTDAVDNDCQGPDMQPMHLHCYTCEAELATALRAQTGSWAGKNDLELKSFHNEYAGVDYANDQSVNGIIQVNWNQVVSGTQEAMSRKIKPSTVLDGLVTRMALFPMPQNDFQMIARQRAYRDNDRECYLRSIGLKLEEVRGELKVSRLVDFCYHYEQKLTDEARLEQDLCLDYFRKRIPVLMMRYTLVRIVCREINKAVKGEPLTIEDSDLEFARLIGDWCLTAQMHMFGQMVMEALEREQTAFTPRKRSSKVREAYASLPMEGLTAEKLVEQGACASVNTARVTLHRWFADGLVSESGKGIYKKKYTEIPI